MKGITIIIILFAISLVIIAILIALLILGERKVSVFDEAFLASITNISQCQQQPFKCQLYKSNPPIPQFSTTFSPDIAKFVGQLIVNLSNDIFNGATENSLILPQNLKLITTLDTNYDSNPIIGYIATDVNNTLYIIFRGTLTDNEWYQDFQVDQILVKGRIMIHSGFYQIFQQFQQKLQSTLTQFPNINDVVIAGHSLGGALSSLSAFSIQPSVGSEGPIQNKNIVMYTFGKPRVGNIAYADYMNSLLQNRIYRIENENDLIPTIPLSATANISNPSVPWVYEHEGVSIRFNDNWGSLGLNHSMTNYMTFINL